MRDKIKDPLHLAGREDNKFGAVELNCNIIIPQFAQIPRGLSQIFKIMSQKGSDDNVREIEISDGIIYRGKYLNGYDLRTFLFLTGQLSAGRKVAKKLNAKHSDVVKLLDAKINSDNRIIAPALTDWNVYKEIKNMIGFFGLQQKWDNRNVFERSIMNLESSYLYLDRLIYNGKFIAVSYLKHLLIFNPIFYALIERHLALTTVDLIVAKVLARNVNKLVIYYALCDMVDFGESVRISVESLFPLWHDEVESRQAKNKRMHFITQTLDEISILSDDFKFTFYDESYFVRRIKNLRRKT
jgi:hypothetical protein